MGRLKNLYDEEAEQRAAAAQRLPAPASSAAAGPAAVRLGRHELSPELAALITASMPPNTKKAWASRFDRGFRPWAEERYGRDRVMPPTDEMLTEYLRFLAYEKQLKVTSLEAHLGTVLGVTRAWVDQQCAVRATWRAGRAEDRALRHRDLQAEAARDVEHPPADAEQRAAARAAMRRLLDEEELADARHEHGDPKVPGTRLAHRLINAYSRELAQNPEADTERRKATGITPDEYRRIILEIEKTDISTAAGKRDKALIAVWYSIFRRSAETSRLATTDIRFAEGLGMRVTIRYSKTDPAGRKEDVIKVPFAKDPQVCPVRAAEAWLRYLAEVDDRRPGGPRYAARGQTKPLWPRVDRYGYLGTVAWSSGDDDDGALGTKGLARILAARATAAGIELGGFDLDEFDDPHRRQISTHSMRRGPITAALNKGKNIAVVARHAGIADGSRTIYEYWEQSGQGWDKENNALDGLL